MKRLPIKMQLKDNVSLFFALLVSLWTLAEGYVINGIVTYQPQYMACWSCPKHSPKGECATHKVARICPKDYSVCQTIHKTDLVTGVSVLVAKRCAKPSECDVTVVGCHDSHSAPLQDCISCCNYPYCNSGYPSNVSAMLYTFNQSAAIKGGCHSVVISFILLTLLSFQ